VSFKAISADKPAMEDCDNRNRSEGNRRSSDSSNYNRDRGGRSSSGSYRGGGGFSRGGLAEVVSVEAAVEDNRREL
jgi:hypothetical protein